MRLKLGLKLGFTYLVLIVLSVAAFGYFTMDFFQRSFLDEKKAALFTHANILANSSAPYLRDREQRPYLNYLARNQAERVGCRFLILDRTGLVMADSAGDFRGRALGHPEILSALEGKNTAAPYREAEYGWVLYLAVPVYSGKQVIGAVFVSADLNPMVARLDEIRARLLWFSAASGAVVFVISLFMGTFLTRPVKRLIVAAGRIGSGDYGYRIKTPPGNDEFGELTRVFNDMSTKIQAEDNIRKRFVADASHELKSPVAAITALLDSCPRKEACSPEEYHEMVKDLRFEAGRLKNLVEDLLVLSRLEGNRRQLKIENTSVGEIAEAVRKAAAPTARSKGVEIKTVHPGDIYWQLDGEKIFRVLVNLVDNAVKYSPAGEKVTLGFRVQDERLHFYVSNRGAGIPSEEIPHIFERFYRVDKARSRGTGGWGLGLAIVKEIVELHGGGVVVDSEPGGETIFTIGLPKLT
ncbi:sensor histidine kinase [Phosphitispora fastidiosa]|uniref:sensor histidine kinase n=1 Tax=Phosphitispora fastidiosa TaxID=2837202 RepID=UPI001E400EA9|nr:HAMP domain-containing sensor histidine kinase [Phosphitispora fastidiosa]MBU7006155.1 signal transduction histidine kinase [Phosphitispora fastidiosa]